MMARSRAPPLRPALLLASFYVAFNVLRYDCFAFSPPRSFVVRAETVGRLFSTSAVREDDARPDIAVLRTTEDYAKFLARDERLCVIKFYANWCKSCQRFGVKFRHLAFDEGDRLDTRGSVVRAGGVRFAEAEYSAAAALCKSLNIRKLPTVHMHRQGEKVVDMVCKPSLFHLVVDEVHRWMEGAELPHLVTPGTEPDFTGGGNGNVTNTSFDELADEIMASLRKDEKDSVANKEKSSWFPFTL